MVRINVIVGIVPPSRATRTTCTVTTTAITIMIIIIINIRKLHSIQWMSHKRSVGVIPANPPIVSGYSALLLPTLNCL